MPIFIKSGRKYLPSLRSISFPCQSKQLETQFEYKKLNLVILNKISNIRYTNLYIFEKISQNEMERMPCWKCKKEIDINVGMDFFCCEDFHILCTKCRTDSLLKCFCEKEIRKNSLSSDLREKLCMSSQERISEINITQPDLVNCDGTGDSCCLQEALIRNNLKKADTDSKNNILKQSRESLMRFDDMCQVS